MVFLCECGCGNEVGTYKYGKHKGEPRKFKDGHNMTNNNHRTLDLKELLCVSCGEVKSTTEFYTTTDSRRVEQRFKTMCKPCYAQKAKEYRDTIVFGPFTRGKLNNLSSFYKISVEEFKKMWTSQGQCCKICERDFTPTGGTKLVVDHCHDSKKVRGLLCHDCNVGLGRLGDNVKGLEKALAYLRESEV